MVRLVKANRLSFTAHPFVRSLRYSADAADGCSRGMAFWDTKRKLRSRSGPDQNFGDQLGILWWGDAKEKAEVEAPALGI